MRTGDGGCSDVTSHPPLLQVVGVAYKELPSSGSLAAPSLAGCGLAYHYELYAFQTSRCAVQIKSKTGQGKWLNEHAGVEPQNAPNVALMAKPKPKESPVF